MDNNNWRPVQAKEEPATDNGDWRPAQAKEEPATDNGDWRPAKAKDEPATDNGDWRIQLQNESRQRIVKKIMDTLMRHFPHSGEQGLQDLKDIAMKFEEKIYTGATSQADYLRKISVKMITMESKSQNPTAKFLPSSDNTADAAQQPNSTSMNSGQLFGQKTNFSKLQQQPPQLLTSQQQLGLQGNLLGLQQQQMFGTESGNNPSMQNNQNLGHIMHQTKVSTLQQNYQNTTALLPSQGQHSQPQAPHQQINPQFRQRLQRTMPEVPSSPLDSTVQTGNGNSGDWQEETYQKILTMKEAYYPELQEMHTKIASKLHQYDTLPHQPRSELVEKFKAFKSMLEGVLVFLQVSKSNILPIFKDKLGSYEKQIVNILNINRPRKPESRVLQPQEQCQICQVQSHVNPMSSRVQSMNLQGSMNTLQHNANSLQQDPLSSLSRVPNSSQSLISD